jgi:hypothetical protein
MTESVPIDEVLRHPGVVDAAVEEFDVPTPANKGVPHCMGDTPNNYHRPEHNQNECGKADYPIV